MKKIFSCILTLVLVLQAVVLTACKGGGEGEKEIPQYTVTTEASEGGTLVADKSKVSQGDSVSFSVSCESDYMFKSLTLNGGEVELVNNGFTLNYVLENITAKAVFTKKDIVIQYQTGEGEAIANAYASYGDSFGNKLPNAVCVGKKFVGWKDQNGVKVSPTSPIDYVNVCELTAMYEDFTQEEIDGLAPYSITTSYHDMAATKYGVVFHTAIEPVAPTIYVKEGNTEDFSGATIYDCDVSEWLGEYVAQSVLDNLKYETEYSVKIGDRAANQWSKVYHFTTRKQTVEKTQFFFMTDTQETYKIKDMENSTYNHASYAGYLGDTYFSKIMEEATAKFPDAQFLLHGGDYVHYGAEPYYWREMMDSVDEYLFNIPTMITAGNHADPNWYSAGYKTVSELFNISYSSDMKRLDAGIYYSFDYGPAHMICLRTNDVLSCDGYYSQEQVAWLRNDLAKARNNPETPWIVVYMHEGLLNPRFVKEDPNHHENKTIPQILPILTEFNVEFLLYGHEHELYTTYPLVWDESVKQEVNGINRDGIKVVTTDVSSEVRNGEELYKFNYASGVEQKGVVMHTIAPSGPQWKGGSAYNFYPTNNAENVAQYKFFRRLLTSGVGYIKENVGYSMYSYVEITDNELVCRTYGVGFSPKADNKYAYEYADHIYVDGLILQK